MSPVKMNKKDMIKDGAFIECSTRDHYGGLIVTFADGKDILFQVDTDIESVMESISTYRGKEYILSDYYDFAE